MVRTPPRPRDLCRNPNCESSGASRRVFARGRCAACYQMVRRMIKAGILSGWEEAERLGYVEPRGRPGRTSGRTRYPDLDELRARKNRRRLARAAQ